jgi:hypothetical protein
MLDYGRTSPYPLDLLQVWFALDEQVALCGDDEFQKLKETVSQLKNELNQLTG